MKTHNPETLQREIAELRVQVAYHADAAATFAKYATWQDEDIADAVADRVNAEEALHRAKAKKDAYLSRAATEQADGEDAAHLLAKLVTELDSNQTTQ